LEWRRNGLGTPAEVTNATEEYRNEMDVLSDFLSECCTEGKDLNISSKDLYQAYSIWCEENGDQQIKKISFGRKLKEKGFVAKQLGKKRTRFWLGLDLMERTEIA
jgi:putative DNA primase/helicase